MGCVVLSAGQRRAVSWVASAQLSGFTPVSFTLMVPTEVADWWMDANIICARMLLLRFFVGLL